MKLTTKTLGMMAVAGLLVLLNALDLREAVVAEPELPALPEVKLADVTRITIGDQINKLVIERENQDAPWQIVAPLQYRADAEAIKAFVGALGDGIEMDTVVDEGNLEEYGVDDQHALRAELYTGAETPALAVVVGKTAGPSSSFVRLPGSEVVYRAEVGQRSRFEKPAGQWRDRTLIEVEAASVSAFELTRGAEVLRFSRGPAQPGEGGAAAKPGAWRLEGATFPLDDEGVEMLLRPLLRLRAGEIHNPDYDAGFDPPAAMLTVHAADGRARVLTLGSKQDARAAWVKVTGREDVFRVSAQLRQLLTIPLPELRDKALARFDRQLIDKLSWTEGSLTVAVQWLPEELKWVVTQPANTAVDQRAIIGAAGSLAQLRAFAIANDAVFTPTGTSVALQLRDGTRWQLDLGQTEAEGKLVRVRVSGRAEVFLVDARSLAEVRGAFGR